MDIKYFKLATFLWVLLWLGFVVIDWFDNEEQGFAFLVFPIIAFWGTYLILRKKPS